MIGSKVMTMLSQVQQIGGFSTQQMAQTPFAEYLRICGNWAAKKIPNKGDIFYFHRIADNKLIFTFYQYCRKITEFVSEPQ